MPDGMLCSMYGGCEHAESPDQLRHTSLARLQPFLVTGIIFLPHCPFEHVSGAHGVFHSEQARQAVPHATEPANPTGCTSRVVQA
jgi:hypothetical protein